MCNNLIEMSGIRLNRNVSTSWSYLKALLKKLPHYLLTCELSHLIKTGK
jgi:hypothetical protein